MFFSNRTLSGFWDQAFENPTCTRCLTRISEYEVWRPSFKEEGSQEETGRYAAIAQIFKKNRVSGGLLCEKCIVSFRLWMKEGELA